MSVGRAALAFRMRGIAARLRGIAGCTGLALVFSGGVRAARAEPAQPAAAFLLERAAVRFASPETGGLARPRMFTERELSCLARLEALAEEHEVKSDYADRFRRAVSQRAIGEELLAALQVARGSEPRNLLGQAARLRADLAARVGGVSVLESALRAEGIAPAELDHWLRQRVRAAAYVDGSITPLFGISEDELFGLFQSSGHPFQSRAFDESRADFARFVAYERLRRIAVEYLQSARSRVSVVYL